MPIVPTLQTQRLSPIFQSGAGGDATTFGAGVGRAVSGLGTAVDRTTGVASDIVNELQMQDNDREAKALDAEFTRRKRDLLFGEEGFYTNKGIDAVNAAPAAKQAIEELRAELLETGSNQSVSDMFGQVSQQRIDADLTGMDRYTIGERQQSIADTSEARINEAISEASVNYDNPQFLVDAEDTIKAEIEDLAALNGWTEDITNERLESITSDMVQDVVERAAIADVGAAEDLYIQHQDKMTGESQLQVEDHIRAIQRQNVIDSERADRIRGEQLERKQDNNYAFFMVKAARGELTEDELVSALDLSMVRPNQYLSALSFNRDELTDGGDDQEANRITIDLYRGRASMEDVAANPNLDTEQKRRLIEIADEVERRGPVISSQRSRMYQDRIETVVGGDRDQLGNFLDAQGGERVSVAVEEYQRRVVEGEDPKTVADELITLYRPSPVDITSLPRSPYWPLKGPGAFTGGKEQLRARLDTSQERLAVELSEGRITANQFDTQDVLLRRYELLIDGLPDAEQERVR